MRPKIRIVSPKGRAINPYTMSSLMYNCWEIGKQGIDIDSPRAYDEYPISRARNIALDEFVTSDCTHMFTWDDDQIFPKGTLTRMITSEQSIVSGWYMARKGNLGLVVFGRKQGKELLNYNDFNFYYPLSIRELFGRKSPSHPSLAKVEGIGLGCTLITKEAAIQLKNVSSEIDKPVFLEWSPIMKPDIHAFGEDLWFSDFCAYADIPLYVHLRAFIGHWAAQGFVIGTKHLQLRAMEEGFSEFNIAEFS